MHILLIGGGHMGTALARCWHENVDACTITIAETDGAKRAALRALGFDAPEELELPEEGFDLVVLAIKPQGFNALAPQLGDIVGEATLVSIMAGIDIAALQQISPHAVRVMPNTPATIGEGMSAIYAPDLDDARMEQVKTLFGTTGHILIVGEEQTMHAVTAISGSGPAYVFAFMEALESAALKLGLDATSARALVTQTVLGAALLADMEGGDAARLRQQVTSPGGTTQAALRVFEEKHLDQTIEAAARAAWERSQALST